MWCALLSIVIPWWFQKCNDSNNIESLDKCERPLMFGRINYGPKYGLRYPMSTSTAYNMIICAYVNHSYRNWFKCVLKMCAKLGSPASVAPFFTKLRLGTSATQAWQTRDMHDTKSRQAWHLCQTGGLARPKRNRYGEAVRDFQNRRSFAASFEPSHKI